MGIIKSTFPFMLGTVCGVYIAQNYNVPNINKLADCAVSMAKQMEQSNSLLLNCYTLILLNFDSCLCLIPLLFVFVANHEFCPIVMFMDMDVHRSRTECNFFNKA
ncbi:hypothetical protein LXL04_035335 [Taraxacum kok-saghyz]